MPKTTERNLILCTSKFEAEVTNNKKLHLSTIDAMKLTTDRHEASRGLFVTVELLVRCSLNRCRPATAVLDSQEPAMAVDKPATGIASRCSSLPVFV